jgi:parallel beta-helix repeat protein
MKNVFQRSCLRLAPLALSAVALSGAAMAMGPIIPPQPRTLYVGPAGVDAGNSCMDPAHPCRQIQRAIDVSIADDRISVDDGNYEGFVIVDRSRLFISPLRTPSNVAVRATSLNTHVRLTRASDILLHGLQIVDSASNGISVVTSNNISIYNCRVLRSAGRGIAVLNGTGRIEVVGNAVSDSRYSGIVFENVDQNATEYRITDNVVTGNALEGIYVGSQASPAYGWPVHILGNTIENNGTQGIRFFGMSHTTVDGNTIRNNRGLGVQVDLNPYSVGGGRFTIRGNTIAQGANGLEPLDVKLLDRLSVVRSNTLSHPTLGGIVYRNLAPTVDNCANLMNTVDSDANRLNRITIQSTQGQVVVYSLQDFQRICRRELNSLPL